MWAFYRFGLLAIFRAMPDETGARNSGADDEIERRLRELTEEVRQSRIREPSAAERARLAERKSRRPRGRMRGHARLTAWTIAIVLVAGGIFGWSRLARPTTGGADDTQVVRSGPVPSVSVVSPVSVPAAPPADPFAGTPADRWADGAAGITVPAAGPVGDYTTAQVRYAYDTTRNLLIAAALNPPTLAGGAPTAFAALLTQPQRTEFTQGLNKIGLDKDGAPLSNRTWVVSFAPGTSKPIGSVIKVNGTMSARQGKLDGNPMLVVTVNYIFVYPVEPPRAPADWMRVVAHMQGPVQFAHWAGASTAFAPWWLMSGPSVGGGRCGMPDGYIHPDYPNGPPDKIQASGPAVNPYSMATGGPTVVCQQTTGT